MKNFRFLLVAIAIYFTSNNVMAHDHPHLHVSDRWKECSVQIDPSLTQEAWHQFAGEAGLVTYFRPLIDAKPMGIRRFEFSILQWNTKIDEGDEAWNNTFVHPNEEHWLIGGEELSFPGFSLRAGITKKLDAAIFWSKRPSANYGVIGAQVQYNLIDDTTHNWALSTRASFSSLYGPEDLYLTVYGTDFLVSKKFQLFSPKFSISPYAGLTTYLSHAHEKTEVVSLHNENIFGVQSIAGAALEISFMRLGLEYNVAKVNSFNYKLGVNFKF